MTATFAGFFGVSIYESYFKIPDEVAVPVITGKKLADANKILENVGLVLALQESRHTTKFPSGVVISQDPAAGELAPRDSVVTVWTSGDYEGALVPQVIGRTFAEAEPLLDQAGLLPQGINADGALLPQDKVFRLDPSAGSKVPPGTPVTVFVSPF